MYEVIHNIVIGYEYNRPGEDSVPVYEEVHVPHQDHGDSGRYGRKSNTHVHPHHKLDGDINGEQLSQEQAVNVSYFPLKYLTPAITKPEQGPSSGQVMINEENTYQPLIPPRSAALGDDKSDYQSLTHKSLTLPAKVRVHPPKPAVPAIPLKPKAPSTMTQGHLQQFKM